MPDVTVSNYRGICPICNSDIQYVDCCIADGYVVYPFVCNNCGADGSEYHKLEYSHSTAQAKE